MTYTPPSYLRPLNAASGDHHLARRRNDGELLRLYAGQYVALQAWQAASSVDRYELQLRALASHTRSVFCCESALWFHGVPTFGVPTVISSVAKGGRHGLQPSGLPEADRSATLAYYAEHVRHRHPDAPTVKVGDVACVTVEHAAACVIHRSELRHALTVSDAIARSGAQAGQRVVEHLSMITHSGERARSFRRLEAGRSGAQSPAESASRAILLEAGFPEPELQHTFRDHLGFIGDVDAWWEPQRLIGEIDGMVKYTDPEMTNGRTAVEVVRAEKERENRLLATGAQLRRWGWPEISRPERLVRLLASAGLPRSTRPLLV